MSSNRPESSSGIHLKLEHLVQDPSFAVATLDNYVLLVWRQRVSVAGARAVAEAFKRLHALKRGQKLGFITLIEDGCSPSAPSEVRQLMAATLNTHQHNIGAAAIIYELEGFWSAFTRSVITAINLASRVAFPSEVTANRHEGIRFVTRELRDSSEARGQGLRAALELMESSPDALQQPG